MKRFSFFNELNALLKKELKKEYDIVIQAAAVSDYALESASNKKISSGRKSLKLTLKPTLKIINCLRKFKPDSFLVGFKFQPHLAAGKLLIEARNLIKEARLDLAVANSARNKQYSAYLVSEKKSFGPFLSKEAMAINLVKLIGSKF